MPSQNINIDVSIIIINYNTKEQVDVCLESIIRNTYNLKYEIIVVDNLSEERTIEELVPKYTNVKFYFRNCNSGFGSGCNYGFSNSKGKYILLLNPDTIVISNIAKDFFDFLEINSNIGVCSTLLEGCNGKLQYCYNYFPSLTWEIQELTTFLSNRKVDKLLKIASKKNISDDFMVIDWAIGACLFIRREVFVKVNGFDESFFLYYEDTDLQYRIKMIGFKIVLLNNLKIIHIGKSSIDNNLTGDNIYYLNMHISKLKYFYKHSSGLYVFSVRIVNVFALILRFIVTFIKYISLEKKKNRIIIIIKIIKIYFNSKKSLLKK